MGVGLIGKKLGMTRIFLEDGREVPVTVIEAGPCAVVQKKTAQKEGYDSVQVGLGLKKKKVNSPMAGHFKKAGVEPCMVLKEFRTCEADEFKEGDELKANMFAAGDFVDVSAISKGKGFSGVMKRWNFGGAASNTHGTHKVNRKPGSIGMSATPARVFKGTKMAGRKGGVRSVAQNLRVARVDAEKNLVLVCGAVAGFPGGYVIIKKAKKK
jgi:large subunit ribosomal protein L3